ncbi:MAG: response regulator transcription factor [Chloroflexota bacterium]|nr:response regulator transcription factor [Chloroflexota bacterium]
MPSKTSVLVVDDDIRMLRMMRRILELEGFQVMQASDGRSALALFDDEAPALVLLDIMMPGLDGCAVCRRIREFSHTPIIMVTARGNDEQKVEGLDAGADDYVTKPFSARELIARVRAVLRRCHFWEEKPQPAFRLGNLTVDFAAHRVTVGGEEVDVTATEYKILAYLAQNAGRVVTPDNILHSVWGEEYGGESHLVQVNIARLRKKIGDDVKNPRCILTRPGIGYLMPYAQVGLTV